MLSENVPAAGKIFCDFFPNCKGTAYSMRRQFLELSFNFLLSPHNLIPKGNNVPVMRSQDTISHLI